MQHLDRLLKQTLPMARIETQRLPNCPEITLRLINADFPLGPLAPEVMAARWNCAMTSPPPATITTCC